MKFFKHILGAGLIAAAALSLSVPAEAAVNCPKWPNPTQTGSTYPLNGRIYNCMPTPRNGSEAQLQSEILNAVNSAIAGYNNKRTQDLEPRNIDIQVSYTAADSYAKNGVLSVPGEPPSGSTETGRSWTLPNRNPPVIANPTTSVWVYTVAQWNAVPGSPKIPTNFNSTQLGGTVRHELGHQFDRIWAQKQGYAPAASSTVDSNTTNTKWVSAFTIDANLLTTAEVAQIQTNWPWMMSNGQLAHG